MGFNTVAVILNDQLSEIAKDAKFGESISQAVSTFGHGKHYGWDAGRASHGAQIISLGHADYPQVCVIYGNTGWSIHDADIPAGAVQAVADALRLKGYGVTEPKSEA